MCLRAKWLAQKVTNRFLLMNFFGAVGGGPRTNRLDFCGDPDHDPDSGIFLRIFYRGIATVSRPSLRPSVCPSVTLTYRGHNVGNLV